MSTAWLSRSTTRPLSGVVYLLFPVIRKVVGRGRLIAVTKSSHSESGTMPCF